VLTVTCVWEGAGYSRPVTDITGTRPDSRAVTMIMRYNDLQECVSCGENITFLQATSNIWVVANVYVDCDHSDPVCRLCLGYGRRWDRIEHWHEDCYGNAGKPYGDTEFRKTKVVGKNGR